MCDVIRSSKQQRYSAQQYSELLHTAHSAHTFMLTHKLFTFQVWSNFLLLLFFFLCSFFYAGQKCHAICFWFWALISFVRIFVMPKNSTDFIKKNRHRERKYMGAFRFASHEISVKTIFCGHQFNIDERKECAIGMRRYDDSNKINSMSNLVLAEFNGPMAWQ